MALRLRGAIKSLGQGGPFEVLRKKVGTWVDGKYIDDGEETVIPMQYASIQPTEGEEVADLPEGQRGDEILLIITETRLVARRRATATDPPVEPDRIREAAGATPSILSGETWVVVKIEKWFSFGEDHCEAFIARSEAP